MTVSELKRILQTFVNEPSELDIQKGRIVAQIHDELVDVLLSTNPNTGELSITDGDVSYAPRAWLLRRVAKLDLLAERILNYTPDTPAFVVPSGSLRGDLSSTLEDADLEVADLAECLERRISAPLPATTSILYLTSDAGEGKTTLIGQVARRQAERCRTRSSSTLLLPIPLGGKTFLRFDDVVIGTLSNRYRFNRYYFDSFLELVRLGAIVPAFDGFEEMFVEGHSGEAVSALGTLIESLESSGSMVVAARKAFFEFNNFRTQAQLFDAIKDRSASFSRLKINRWGEAQFMSYAKLRRFSDAESLYERFCTRLPTDHPMLSRAFLVKRLFDLAGESSTIDQLVADLGSTPQDYFFKFVETIVEREARLKWLDKTGDASHPLLALDEHHDLLASIAREMWQSSVYALRLDVVDVIVDLFSESKGRSPTFARQVRERIKTHSLLATDPSRGNLLEFDHDEFRRFYLGEALGRALAERQHADLLSIVSTDRLPSDTCDQALNHIGRVKASSRDCVEMTLAVSRSASPLSFARENCAALTVRLLSNDTLRSAPAIVESMDFPLDSLVGRSLKSVCFVKCRFEATWLTDSMFSDVHFEDCEMERLDMFVGDSLAGTTFERCRIKALRLFDSGIERNLYGPGDISNWLIGRGGSIHPEKEATQTDEHLANDNDAQIEQVERFLRVFLRATQVNENTIRAKFGNVGQSFIDDVLPTLVRARVVELVEYRGRGVQNRYKLAAPMQVIQRALVESGGSFDRFLSIIALG